MFAVGIVRFLIDLEAYKSSNSHPHSSEPEILLATQFRKLRASEQGRTINHD